MKVWVYKPYFNPWEAPCLHKKRPAILGCTCTFGRSGEATSLNSLNRWLGKYILENTTLRHICSRLLASEKQS